ncbi:hypothetical protein [Bradyrhizobium phage BDU-MI-1]|nr:hypothetical protein [Bradyrhizobium phage BDU-MI-1]
MQTKFFDATIYRTTPGHGDTTVGITFRPTPNMTEHDLKKLIDDLQVLALEVRIASMP